MGAMFGLAVGDALGAPVEFKKPGTFQAVNGFRSGGPFSLVRGGWTDDTSMSIALGESLIACGDYNPSDIMRRWNSWRRTGEYSHNGVCFDIGNQTRTALTTGVPAAGMGNGGIMRLSPAVMWGMRKNNERGVVLGVHQNNLTHPDCVDYARVMSTMLVELCSSGASDELEAYVAEGILRSTGFVRDTLDIAVTCVWEERSFADAVLRAVNYGGDADTAGAVTGQLAGAMWGYSSIPEKLRGIVWRRRIEYMCERIIR